MVTDKGGSHRPPDDTEISEQQSGAALAEQETSLLEIIERVARVRHEINNPLTGVLGQAQLLLREPLPTEARKRVEIIEQLARRIRDIVAELRDIQHPNSNVGYDDPEVKGLGKESG